MSGMLRLRTTAPTSARRLCRFPAPYSPQRDMFKWLRASCTSFSFSQHAHHGGILGAGEQRPGRIGLQCKRMDDGRRELSAAIFSPLNLHLQTGRSGITGASPQYMGVETKMSNFILHDQWLEADLKARSSSTPIVVFAHIPLWSQRDFPYGDVFGVPEPAPGTAPAAGPMKVPAERLRSVLGITNVQYVARKHSLAVVDSPLAAGN